MNREGASFFDVREYFAGSEDGQRRGIAMERERINDLIKDKLCFDYKAGMWWVKNGRTCTHEACIALHELLKEIG